MEKVSALTDKEADEIFQRSVSGIVKYPEESFQDFKKRVIFETAIHHACFIGDESKHGMTGLLNSK